MKKVFLYITILLLIIFGFIGLFYFMFLSKSAIEKRFNKVLKEKHPDAHFVCENTFLSFKGLKNKKISITLKDKVVFEAEDVLLSLDFSSLFYKREKTVNLYMKVFDGYLDLKARSHSFRNFQQECNLEFKTDNLKLDKVQFFQDIIKKGVIFGDFNSVGSLKIIDQKYVKECSIKLNIINGKVTEVDVLKELNFDVFKVDIALLNDDASLQNGFFKGEFFGGVFGGDIILNRQAFQESTLNINCKVKMKEPFLEKLKKNNLLKFLYASVFVKEELDLKIEGSFKKPKLNLGQ